MRRIIMAALVGAVCVVAWVAPASAKVETITGRVVDLYCYNPMTKANSGMHHGDDKECAWACAKWEGQPVGIVTADGKIYQLAGGLVADNNAKIAPHVTHTVTITGDVVESHGVMKLTASEFKMVSK